jgi:FAD/FMN-containing dehydrogenase
MKLELIEKIAARLGPKGVSTDLATLAPHLVEWRGRFQGETPVLVTPASTEEVCDVVRLCAEAGVAITPQGGNTGLVGGQIPQGEVLLSLKRMNRIREVDATNDSLVAEAGVVLTAVQQAAADSGRLFPLSLASEGSATIGGLISTNAGGVHVLRYGMMRELVLGLEVVLADGGLLRGLKTLRKDNTGYDLKQLFIGAEGTLGFVTAATCKLFPCPRSVVTAWLAVPSVSAAIAVYVAARDQLGDDLTAFEFANWLTVDFVQKHIPGSRSPLNGDSPCYLLVEVSTSRLEDALESQVQEFLVHLQAAGLVADGVVAASGPQRDALWRLRHSMSEAQKSEGASIKHDISVPVASMEQFLGQATVAVEKLVPGVRVVAFGHLGDGNVHFNLSQPTGADGAEFLARWAEISHHVHEIAISLGGSFSAEHGIGVLKVQELATWRGGVPLDLMQTVKRAIDPLGIMNPGKLFSANS